MKRWLAVLAVAVGLAASFSRASAGSQEIREFVLFGGSNTDSLEQQSTWFPVQGARRVVIRTWSAKAAFHASTDADSTFSDSVTTFRILLSDSVGAFVTSHRNQTIPAAADSIVFDPSVASGDTAKFLMHSFSLPINKELRGPSNGSGLLTLIAPITRSGISASLTPDASGVIVKQYARITVTPLRRNTVTGGNSTAGKRVNGLKGLRMRAYVFYENR